jgi:hypothetical protein
MLDRHPKYLWYYAAAVLLLYVFWSYYKTGGMGGVGGASWDAWDDHANASHYEPSRKLSFASLQGDVSAFNDGDLYDNAANLTKGVTSTIEDSMSTLSSDIGGLSNLLPDFQSNSLESSLIQSTQSDNMLSTPSYHLSKSHILLERQLPPTVR